ncbi:PREDICTED: beta-galactoside alpha-2,6-sialyltransferase 1-like [Branchiostoma belcheri]|uniref:beta-galactoside alpha-(2,6)-sialyltransferase n=1 Tax=Branchiostoma belcheri TaxID=7741 RepID=A0A6P4YUA4_BRABE|nr:PREDICTED: beta-galactoside alpha-2,6-sialyltransferase 1-like [Branchiostoma belcheri]
MTKKQAAKDKNRVILPKESLEKLVHFNSCAVVSNSHALRFYTYGQEIDSHDAVLRFNCAPTHNFENFVGNRTDIRMINTLIPYRMCREEFWSKNSSIFKHGILVIRNMDGIESGRQDFGLDIRKELVRFCDTFKVCEKTKKSPSTGLFGIVMMLHLCDWVRVYELVPSNKDNTNLVYYYDETEVRSPNDLHSYDLERTYVKALTLTPDKDIEDTGVVLLKGLSQIHCD